MDIKELTKEEKLSMIDEIIAVWEETGMESFICLDVKAVAVERGWMDCDDWDAIDVTRLLPEMEIVRPQWRSPKQEWFGIPRSYPHRRTEVLQQIREIIKKGENSN
jgi:hypothetical protein